MADQSETSQAAPAEPISVDLQLPDGSTVALHGASPEATHVARQLRAFLAEQSQTCHLDAEAPLQVRVGSGKPKWAPLGDAPLAPGARVRVAPSAALSAGRALAQVTRLAAVLEEPPMLGKAYSLPATTGALQQMAAAVGRLYAADEDLLLASRVHSLSPLDVAMALERMQSSPAPSSPAAEEEEEEPETPETPETPEETEDQPAQRKINLDRSLRAVPEPAVAEILRLLERTRRAQSANVAHVRVPLAGGAVASDDDAALGAAHDELDSALPKCLRLLTQSGWNPVPLVRQAQGDLLYVDAVTLTDKYVCLTASAEGFFVNRSTRSVFDPAPASPAHLKPTLREALASACPGFGRALAQLLDAAPRTLAPARPPLFAHEAHQRLADGHDTAWVAPPFEPHQHQFDPARSARILREHDESSSVEWLSEFSVAAAMPADTVEERLEAAAQRRAMLALFRKVALDGAERIFAGQAPALNPHEALDAQLYVVNGVFFSWSPRTEDTLKMCGVGDSAYAAASKQVVAEQLAHDAAPEGVHVVPLLVIDRLGRRLCAQPVIPGVLHAQNPWEILYGSTDNAQTVRACAEEAALAAEMAGALAIAPGLVAGLAEAEAEAQAEQFELCLPVESKMLRGGDGTRHLMDVVRVTPRDTNWLPRAERERVSAMLKAAAGTEDAEAEKEAKGGDDKKQEESEEEADEPAYVAVLRPELINHAIASQQQDDDGEETEAEPEQPTTFDVNAFFPYSRATPEAELAIAKLGLRLRNQVVPSFAVALAQGNVSAADGADLTHTMHRHGINMRYLGAVARIVRQLDHAKQALPAVLELLEVEMVARAAKYVCGAAQPAAAAGATPTPAAAAVEVLNAVVASFDAPPRAGSRSAQLRADMRARLAAHFKYQPSLWLLERDSRVVPTNPDVHTLRRQHQLPMLRRLCQKLGLRLASRAWDFSSAEPLAAADVAAVGFTVKPEEPRVTAVDAEAALAAAMQAVQTGRSAVEASAAARYAAALFSRAGHTGLRYHVAEQMHISALLSAGAAGDALPPCIALLRSAIDTFGPDHRHTLLAQQLLAKAARALGRIDLAIARTARATVGAEAAGGPWHPDTLRGYLTLGHYFLEAGDTARAEQSFAVALNRSLETVNVGTRIDAMQGIASAKARAEQFAEARGVEQAAYRLAKQALGEDSDVTKRSYERVRQFTASSVSAS